MKFVIDHDYHIHSRLSSCSSDPGQTTQAILNYAQTNGLKRICLTDHFWDDTVPGASEWYKPQNRAHILEALPLPQAENVRFFFGAETDMDRYGTIGLGRDFTDRLDFIIVPTTHLHMGGFTIDADAGFEERAQAWVRRFEILLDSGLPFHKVGLAHPNCALIYRTKEQPTLHLKVLGMIPETDYLRLFRRAARAGMGIELNFDPDIYTEEELTAKLLPYRYARQAGCRFYLGSDMHHPADMAKMPHRFERIIEILDLQEDEKFTF